MIWDSWPWKREVARRAESLQRRANQNRWPESSLQKVEQDVFLAAYSIRKLVDSGKTSDEVESISLQVKTYPKRPTPVDFFNRDKIDEGYDLGAESNVMLNIREICNQIIHSFVFLPSFAEERALAGFFLVSDRAKDQQLFFLTLADLVSLCIRVADDDIITLEAIRPGPGEPTRVTRKSMRPTMEGPAC